jgi:hydrogenase expression/formation protein HypE
MSHHQVSTGAAMTGTIVTGTAGRVSCRGPIGGTRIIDMLSGEQLPYVC